MNRRKQLGDSGEQQAATYLKKHGYRILERNWRHPLGEIDIVAAERRVLVFVEVKTRQGAASGLPEEAVTGAKQRRLAQLAEAYVEHARYQGEWRIDVVAIDHEGVRLTRDAVVDW